MRKTIWQIFILALLAQACLKANEEGLLDTSSNPFSAVTSNAVQEAYVLQINDWNLSENGKSFFQHLIEDEYFGLEIFSSDENPIQQLTVQLGKDIENFTNLLNLKGIFDQSQTMRIKLPESMFNIDSLFLAQNVDYSSFIYEFQAEGNISRASINPDITSTGVYVDLDKFGTVIVRKQCSDGSTPVAGECNSQLTINLTGPTLEFKYYHNRRPGLRTFSWTMPPNASVECSTDGGVIYDACTAYDSHELSVADFNNRVTLSVRVTTDAGEVLTESLNLADASSGYSDVYFYTCNQLVGNMTFANLNTLGFLAVNNNVICFEDNAIVTNPNGSFNSLNITGSNVVLIGDHINRATVENFNTSSPTASNATVFVVDTAEKINQVFANLLVVKPETSIGYGIGLKGLHVGNTSNIVISNVNIDTGGYYALYVQGRNNVKVLDSVITGSTDAPSDMIKFAGEGRGEFYNVSITNESLSQSGNTINFYPSSVNGAEHHVLDNVRVTSNGNGIKMEYDGAAPFTKVSISNSRITTESHAIEVWTDAELDITDSVFVNTSSTAFGHALNAMTYLITLSGSGNKYCRSNTGGFSEFGSSAIWLSGSQQFITTEPRITMQTPIDLDDSCPASP